MKAPGRHNMPPFLRTGKKKILRFNCFFKGKRIFCTDFIAHEEILLGTLIFSIPFACNDKSAIKKTDGG